MRWLLRYLRFLIRWLSRKPALYVIRRKGKHMAGSSVVEGATDTGLSVVTLNKGGRVLKVALPADILVQVTTKPDGGDASVGPVDASSGAFAFVAGVVDGDYVLTPASVSQPLPGASYTETVTPDNTPASFAIQHA